MGTIAIHEKNYDNALKRLTEAQKISEKSNNRQLQILVYESLANLFKKKGDIEKFDFYDEKLKVTKEQIESDRTSVINAYFHQAKDANKKLKKANGYLLYGILSLAFLLTLLTIFIYRLKRKKTKSLNTKIKEAKTDDIEDDECGKFTKEDCNSELIVSEDMKQRILEGLEKLKKTNKFLKPDFGLVALANYLKINIKYVSHVINEETNMNVKTYINTMRMNYIVDKLNTEPEYLTYSIAYLAKESGFSSHSKFSNVFKEVQGLSPSDFIKDLQSKSIA